ncbi:traG-like protein region [Parasutterella excrementihominis CAG:233]|nr:traG-like protein region [Parasutterella excrementihominis CAG:233]
MVMDYYAYWNGGQIRDLFEALVSICSGSSYEGLLKTAVLAGFFKTRRARRFSCHAHRRPSEVAGVGFKGLSFCYRLVLFRHARP